ncbi:MAG: FapA family protein [Syntrophomonadaceae bacterium]|nr:FapA family protein [Syntrophomonadaceae bacterium]MDD3022748.1 FapA family protein [Syntrophomonadaceae bacterium]
MTKEEISQNGQAKVNIPRDQLKAFLVISAPIGSGVGCTMDEAKKALADHNVTYGLIEENIEEALLEENWGREYLVAQGKEAVNGTDAKLIFKFPLPKERMGPKADEQGNVNYHDLGLVYNVRKGSPLVERIPPTEGIPGTSISGTEIVAKTGKDVRLPKGKNTVADNEDKLLYAVLEGNVNVIDNKVVVDPLLQISGDVDYSTGDIDFVGDVLINGNVNTGFKVKAEGNIEIKGFIEGAEVTAGGSILIKGGITGGIKGCVRARENINCRFIENSNVEAGRDIIVKDSIMQSFIKAGGSVRVNDKRAIIVGGIIQAAQEVESKVLGSQLATQTIVEVGINPYFREEYQHLLKSKNEKKKIYDNISNNLQVFQKSGVSPENLNESKRLTLMKMLEDFKRLRQEITEMDERTLYLEEQFNRSHSAKVKVLETVYPGVRISIGQAIYIVNDTIKYAAFVLDEGEVKLTSLR